MSALRPQIQTNPFHTILTGVYCNAHLEKLARESTDPMGREWYIKHRYYKIVEHYTVCKLSFPDNDKLVAFAAIAQQASILLGDRYAAGFFWSNLLLQLRWTISKAVLESGKSCREKGNYRAPSWSWASIDRPVSLDSWPYYVNSSLRDSEHMLAKVLEYQADLVDPQNPFGGVACSTRISVSGCLLPLHPDASLFHSQGYMKISSFTGRYNGARDTVWIMMDELESLFLVEPNGGLLFFPIVEKREK